MWWPWSPSFGIGSFLFRFLDLELSSGVGLCPICLVLMLATISVNFILARTEVIMNRFGLCPHFFGLRLATVAWVPKPLFPLPSVLTFIFVLYVTAY